jgi:cytochrome P450
MDLMKDFACLLPLNVIARLIGIPSEAFPRTVKWTERLARIFDPLVSLEELGTLDRASGEFMAFLGNLIQERRREPQRDLISDLCLSDCGQDPPLTDEEIAAVCILVFAAGEETMVNLLGNGTVALSKHPDQRQYLLQHPEALPGAVDELLRYDAPLQITSRTALGDFEVGGKHIHAGDQVYLAIGSANRDPERWEQADNLVLERKHNLHMAFADGHHLCVGAQLARIEGEEAFRVLLEMVPNMSVDTENLHWRPHMVLRGLTSLPVRFGRA